MSFQTCNYTAADQILQKVPSVSADGITKACMRRTEAKTDSEFCGLMDSCFKLCVMADLLLVTRLARVQQVG